jgi:hypothetical protein
LPFPFPPAFPLPLPLPFPLLGGIGGGVRFAAATMVPDLEAIALAPELVRTMAPFSICARSAAIGALLVTSICSMLAALGRAMFDKISARDVSSAGAPPARFPRAELPVTAGASTRTSNTPLLDVSVAPEGVAAKVAMFGRLSAIRAASVPASPAAPMLATSSEPAAAGTARAGWATNAAIAQAQSSTARPPRAP